jgi:hypothetical protein
MATLWSLLGLATALHYSDTTVCVSNCQFSRRIQDWATLRCARCLTYAISRMMNLLLIFLHVAVMTAKLCGPGGVRAVIAENLLLKQQLIVLRRTRQRAVVRQNSSNVADETLWLGLDSRVAQSARLNVTSAPPTSSGFSEMGCVAMRDDGIDDQRPFAGGSAVYAACRS